MSARRYAAFLSYSHRDRRWADWLHGALEGYRVPKSITGRGGPDGPVPERLSPVFRDREELAAAADLSAEIKAALAASRALIVLCSPAAATSRWTNAEIEQFRALHPDRPVLAAIVDGEPFASEMPAREAEECFPPALRQRFDSEGRPTGERHEPIAADLRDEGDGKPLGLLKLVAGLLGVPLDEIAQREAHRRQRRLTIIAAAAIVGMLFATILATIAIRARNEAWHQREQAEALVGFMLGDLRTRLEPVGRLDVLDAVGSRVLAYYQGQSSGDLSDDALAQRSRALTLIGEIANRRGDLDGALARYREALAGTEEALRRAPNDGQRIFDHAQNVFWVANIDYQRGRAAEAERGFRAYRDLAGRLLAIDPNRPEWRLEAAYADNSLGIILFEAGRYDQAEQTFSAVLSTTEQLRASAPANAQYRDMEGEALAYLADVRLGAGHLDEAIAARERQLRLLSTTPTRNAGDVNVLRDAVVGRRAISRLFRARGEMETSERYLREAQTQAQALRDRDPANMEWLFVATEVETDLGDLLLLSGRIPEAAQAARSACASAQQVVARDRSVETWRAGLRNCLVLRSRISAAQGHAEEALALARRAVAMTSPGERGLGLSRARLLEGDQLLALRDSAAARAAWQAGLAAATRQRASPENRALQFALLRRLGQTAQAAELANWLDGIGYRDPRYVADRRT